ncbi:MAG: response regulator transcription factor [Caldilineaceae bacterium]
MGKLRLLVVADVHVMRLGLRTVFTDEPDFEVVGEADSAHQAIRLSGHLQPDIVVVDLHLSDQSGIEACREIRRQWENIQVLLLTSYLDEELAIDAIRAGVAGYIPKYMNAHELVNSIKVIGQGGAVLEPTVTRTMLRRLQRAEHERHHAAFRVLSERECEVLKHVSAGKTNSEIAVLLTLSEKTVGHHVSAILSKLELTNRIEAATYAVRHRLDQLDATYATGVQNGKVHHRHGQGERLTVA